MSWSFVITHRDGTSVATIASTDTIADARPVLGFRGRDAANDVGGLQIAVPAEHAVNDLFVEDYLFHLHETGSYVSTWIVRSPQVQVIAAGEEGDEVATWTLDHLLGVAAEGIVEPAGAIGSEPNSQDVRYDWTHPDRDNSDFTTPDELGSVTDAQTNYTVTPYGIGQDGTGFVYPGTAKVIGPAGYGWTDDAPAGRCYFYKDIDFGTGKTVVINAIGDNGYEVMIANQTIIPFTIGFGTARSWGKQVVSGVQRVAAVVENGGTVGAEGPCTLALEIVEVDPGDNPMALVDSSDATWGIMEFPANPPGFTVGEIILRNLADEVAAAMPSMVDVVASFTGTNDSAGAEWPDTWDIGTKALTGLEVFWLKELAEKYADFDAHFNLGTSTLYLDAWVKGHGDGSVTLTKGSTLGAYSHPTSPILANAFVSPWNAGGNLAYRENSVAAVSGHPAKRRGLSQGAARSIEQVDREAQQQLAQFSVPRDKPTITQIRTSATSAGTLPPNWSKWSDVTVVVGSRWLADDTYVANAVSFELDRENGHINWTAEVNYRLIPAQVRSWMVLRKMTGPNLGGQSRITTPLDVQSGVMTVGRVGAAPTG